MSNKKMMKVKNIDPVAIHKRMSEAGATQEMMKAAGLTKEEREPIRSGFFVEGMSFSGLCQSIAEVPGVTFSDRRRFFCWSDNIHATFMFSGHSFTIQPDPWGDDTLWVQATSDAPDVPVTDSIQQHILTHGKPRWVLFRKLKTR